MVRDRSRAGVFVACAAAALALVGCPEDRGRGGAAGDEQLSAGQVLGVARAINMGEIEQATAVQGRVTDPDLTAMIDRILQDHRTSQQQLEQVTVQMGLVPEDSELARELTDGVQDRTQDLSGQQGEALSEEFINAQIATHEKALETIDDRLMPATTDPALQQYLTDLRGVISGHLELSRQMQQQADGWQQGTQEPAGTGTREPAGTGTREPAGTGTREPAGTGTGR